MNCNLFLDKYPISHTKTWHIFLKFFRPTFTYCLTCVPVSGPSYELHSASNIITNSGRLWDPNWKTSMAVLKLKLTQLQKSASKNLEHPTHNLKSCRICEQQNKNVHLLATNNHPNHFVLFFHVHILQFFKIWYGCSSYKRYVS